MSQLQLFIPTQPLLETIRSVGRRYEAHLIFRRFKTGPFPARYQVMKLDAPLAEIYNDEGFKQIYLSLAGIPASTES